MLVILEDTKVSPIIKKHMREYYFNNSTKSFKSFNHYTHAAIILMIDRFKNKEYEEFKLDLIALKSFLPMHILIFLTVIVRLLVSFKLDDRIRVIIRKLRLL
jgi:hypothetical protein